MSKNKDITPEEVKIERLALSHVKDTLFLLERIKGITVKQIAKKYKTSERMVQRRIARALKQEKLREAVEYHLPASTL